MAKIMLPLPLSDEQNTASNQPCQPQHYSLQQTTTSTVGVTTNNQSNTMVDSTPLIPDGKDEDEEKQGHKVLCCCDSRKAVLIFNSITLVVVIAFFINGAMIRQLGVRTILKFIADVVVGIAVIVSAFTFGLRGVTAGISLAVIEIIWLTVDVAMGKVPLQDPEEAAGSIAYVVIIYLLRLLILYANSVYVHEKRKGIMAKETYSREKYSCCCNV